MHGNTAGKINLVDLAGSERLKKSLATGDRLVEAKAINKYVLCETVHAHLCTVMSSYVLLLL